MDKAQQDPDWMDNMVEEPTEDELQQEVEEIASEEEPVKDEVEEVTDEDPEDPEEDEPEEEPKAKKAPEKDKEKKDPEHVPLPTFLEEKKQRKELERKIAQMEENQKRYDQLWEKLNQMEESKEAEQVPNFEENPAEHLRHQVNKIQEQTQNLNQTVQTEQQQREQHAKRQQALQQTAMYEQRFASEKPDYYDALQHVRQIAVNNLKPLAEAEGWSEEKIMQAVAQQEQDAAINLMSKGINPAEYMYTVAKNYGWQPKEEQPSEDKAPDESEDSLDTLEKGLKLGSKGGGGAQKRKMTKEFIEGAAPEEFDQAMKEMFGNMKG